MFFLYSVLISQLMKKSLELQVFIVEPLVIFFEFFVIDVKSLKLNLKEFLPRS